MFFHIDEAGNTGNNLFDFDQPRLSYGVLSNERNVDALCRGLHRQILKEIDSDQIHANELGFKGLVKISPYLIQIQRKMRLDFDYYFIEKIDYALILFFEAVFDAGLNKAVRWDHYWTPFRFLIIHKLTVLFDEPLLRESWRLCTDKRIDRHSEDIIDLLTEVKRRAETSRLDARSIEIIVDALDYGIANPLALDFGSQDQKMISPNAVGFQFVVSCIARRVRKKGRKKASSIVIDRQHQFNKAQIGTHSNLGKIAEGIRKSPQSEKDFYVKQPLYVTLDEADVTFKGLPDRELTISNSADSIGLQIVDVYLWLANKLLSGAELPNELAYLWSLFIHRSTTDGISLEAIAHRFKQFEQMLPKYDDMTDEQKQFADEQVKKHRAKIHSFGKSGAD